MNRKFLAFVLLAVALVLAAVAWQQSHNNRHPNVLTVYCAAGLKQPVEAIAARYEAETGTRIQLQYGGTGTLLSQLRIARQGDVFIAADEGALADARKLEVVREVLPVAVQYPVLAVAKGNPKGIKSLADVHRPDVKVALPNPEAASAGKIAKQILGEPSWKALADKAAVMKPTVTEIAADVSLGAADAALVWDATVPQFGLEKVVLKEFADHREHASAAILDTAAVPADALRFARYLSAPDKGGAIFEQQGFMPAGGDKWAAKPELILYSGGVNRPAIEKLIQDFANREGISITTVFNGCGILCAAMKTMGDSSNPQFPDVYYACDVCFVTPVAEHFPEAVLLTEAEIVIAVPKGNPKGIQTLADLARPGLRIGICNAEQSTLGYMTQAMLKSMNLWESVSKNASSQVPTADFLVNQLRTGSLDAAVVYQINIEPQRQHFDAVRLPEDMAKAIQPFAVRADSPHKHLSQRLLAHLRANKGTFEDAGFVWTGDSAPVRSDQIELPEWLQPKK